MEKKTIYKNIADNLETEANAIYDLIQQCVNHNAINEDDANHLYMFVNVLYNLAYKISKK